MSITVIYKDRDIVIQEYDGKVIIHYGQTHVADVCLDQALKKLERIW